ncbi:MAG: hypothetical protein LIO77_08675 [Rikenellaceae bacterium]|nr:hypothetical protein [Rikenellaceae bacterium]
MKLRLCFVSIAAVLLVPFGGAGAHPPDMESITGWVGVVYPGLPVDDRSVCIIDGTVYEPCRVDSLLIRRKAEGAHISFVRSIPAEVLYNGIYVNRGQKSSFIFIGTYKSKKKNRRLELARIRAAPSEYRAVQAGLTRIVGNSAVRYMEGLRPRDIYGIETLATERDDVSAGEEGKLLILWTR